MWLVFHSLRSPLYGSHPMQMLCQAHFECWFAYLFVSSINYLKYNYSQLLPPHQHTSWQSGIDLAYELSYAVVSYLNLTFK